MNAPAPNAPASQPQRQPLPEPSIIPESGWHCTHYFYRFRRERVGSGDRAAGRDAFIAACDPGAGARPERLQTFLISGHKADFALVMMDPDPLKIEAVHQTIMAGPLGGAIEPVWSFVSMSELSEYVPTVEQYRERLIAGGTAAESPELAAKVTAYERRLPMMIEHRLRPDFPEWPAACFYPMGKSRVVGANWFAEPFSRRSSMMAEHAQSGISYAGRVSQLITVGVGLDDWEWMVTLWGRNPQYLKDIVYKMRFDEASARYGEFGPFYVGYQKAPEEILQFCQLA